MEIESLLSYLADKYDQGKLEEPTKMTSSAGREYGLHAIGESTFVNYRPTGLKEDFEVLAVDGGSAELFNTPYWGIGYIKLRARHIVFNTAKRSAKTVRAETKDKFVLFLPGESRTDDIVDRKFYEKGNYLKREEVRFVREVLKKGKVDKDLLLLMDGTIGTRSFYERELLKLHNNVVGVSKRSNMVINRCSASSYLMLKAMGLGKNGLPWYAYPLISSYPGEPGAEMLFCSFVPNATYAFRVDFPTAHLESMGERERGEHIAGQLSKVALFSFDPKYAGYPYPLGAVHTDSVMRPIDRDRAREFVSRKVEGAGMPAEALALIKKDIENEYWYDRFRRRSH